MTDTGIEFIDRFLPEQCLIKDINKLPIKDPRDKEHIAQVTDQWSKCNSTRTLYQGFVTTAWVFAICTFLIIVLIMMDMKGYALMVGMFGLATIGYSLLFAPWWAGDKARMEITQLTAGYKNWIENDATVKDPNALGFGWKDYLQFEASQKQSRAAETMANAQMTMAKTQQFATGLNALGQFGSMFGTFNSSKKS